MNGRPLNEFSQLLQLVHDLHRTVRVQQLQIEVMREQVADLSEQLYGDREQPPQEEQGT